MRHTEKTAAFWALADVDLKPTKVDMVMEHFLPLGEQSSRIQFLQHHAELTSKIF
jgi:hypothetical protein